MSSRVSGRWPIKAHLVLVSIILQLSEFVVSEDPLLCTFPYGRDSCPAWTITSFGEHRFRWEVTRSMDQADNGEDAHGPAYDHTDHSRQGWYIEVYGDGVNQGEKTLFTGPRFDNSGPVCVSFYYHAYGLDLGQLTVLYSSYKDMDATVAPNPESNPAELWSPISIGQGKVWLLAELDVTAANQEAPVGQIAFNVVGGGQRGNFALDDIKSKTGPCHSNDSYCDFEHGRCNFKDIQRVVQEKVMAWTIVSPKQDTRPLGTPSHDISNGRTGHYLSATRADSATVTRAITQSPFYPEADMLRCFTFAFNFQTTNESDTLALSWLVGDMISVELVVAGKPDMPKNQWIAVEKSVVPGLAFSAQFQADLSVGAGISIDNVILKQYPCGHPLNCEFDSESFCEWRQASHQHVFEFDWKTVSPGMPNPPSGLPLPHDNDEQGWMAIAVDEGEPILANGAWLVSKREIPPSLYICLSFWFFFTEKNPDQKKSTSLRVLSFQDHSDGRSSSFRNREENYWILNQTTAPTLGRWQEGKLGRANVDLSYEALAFAAVMGGHKSQFIALDDIKLTFDHCDTIPEQADPSYIPNTQDSWKLPCNFDDGTECSLKEISAEMDDNCRWTVHKGAALSENAGPSSDAMQNPEGYYMYFHVKDKCKDESIKQGVGLATKFPVQNPAQTAQCLQFWYHMYGAPNTFKVFANFTTPPRKLEFQRHGNQGLRWLKAVVTIDNPDKAEYRLIFLAIPGASRLGDIALDEVSLRDGPCPDSDGLCDFEGQSLKFCGFTPFAMSGHTFTWEYGKSSDLAITAFRDRYDHTFMAPEGHIAYANGEGKDDNEKAYLVSEAFEHASSAADYCITFWYQIPAREGGAKLEVFVNKAVVPIGEPQNDFRDPVWTVGSGLDRSWEYGTASVNIGENFKFAFGATNHADAFFALDDIKVIKEKCPVPLTCTFENDACGWTNDFPDDFDWVLHQGANVGELSPGPPVDHTTGKPEGKYAYIGNEYANKEGGDTARFTSQRVTSTASKPDWCFQFYYHMHMESGSHDATLELVAQTKNGNETQLVLIDSFQRNTWTGRAVDFRLAPGDFRLSFKGTIRGANKDVAIAIDDLSGTNAPCVEAVPQDFLCTESPKKISFEKVCDQVKDCGGAGSSDEAHCGTCAFNSEPNFCGYTIATDDTATAEKFGWKTTKAKTPTSAGESGPGAGDPPSAMYLLADYKPGPSRVSAYLDSPWLHETAATCQMAFYYQIYSEKPEDAGTLFLILQYQDFDTTVAILDKSHGGDWEWRRYYADIGRLSGEFRLIFRARKPTGTHGGYIAVDDITMFNCEFHPPTVGACPSESPWKCPITNVCIESEQRCDFTDNCGKGEDEAADCLKSHPVRCDFEKDLCSLRNAENAELKWIQTNERTPTANSGPLRDHTTGLRGGGFAYVSSSINPADVGKEVRLYSPEFASRTAADNCFIRFYWHMYGSTVGELKLEILNGTILELEPFWHWKGDYGDIWHPTSQQIISRTPFEVVFTAVIGGNSSDIALDDVSFSEGCRLASDTPGGIPTGPVTPAPGHTLIPIGPGAGTGTQRPVLTFHPKDLGGGPIAGIVIGFFVCVALAVVAVIVVQRRRMASDTRTALGSSNYLSFRSSSAGIVSEEVVA